MQRLTIGKVPVDVVTFEQAMDRIEALVEAKQGGFVVTPNIDHVVNVEDDAAFERIYSRASLSVADGMPLVWASKLLRTPLPERSPRAHHTATTRCSSMAASAWARRT